MVSCALVMLSSVAGFVSWMGRLAWGWWAWNVTVRCCHLVTSSTYSWYAVSAIWNVLVFAVVEIILVEVSSKAMGKCETPGYTGMTNSTSLSTCMVKLGR